MNLLKIKVLWLEDNERTYELRSQMLADKLSENGYILEAIKFEDLKGLQSLNPSELLKFDLILTDLSMSGNPEDGVDVINTLRENRVLTPIILYSNNTQNKLEDLLAEHKLQGVFVINKGQSDFDDIIMSHIEVSIHKLSDVRIMHGVMLSAVSEIDKVIYDKYVTWTKQGESTQLIEQIKSYLIDKKTISYNKIIEKLNDEKKFLNNIKSTINFGSFERVDYLERLCNGNATLVENCGSIKKVIAIRNKLAHWSMLSNSAERIVFEDGIKPVFEFDLDKARDLRCKLIEFYNYLLEYEIGLSE